MDKATITEVLEDIQEDVDADDWDSALTNVASLRELLEKAQEEGAQP